MSERSSQSRLRQYTLTAGLVLLAVLIVLARLAPALAQKEPVKLDLEVLKTPITIKDLQTKMAAEASDPALRQTRLDRVYFDYLEQPGGVRLELRFEGISLDPTFNKENLSKLLLANFYATYPDLKDRFERKPKAEQPVPVADRIEPIRLVDNPARLLQARAGREPSLEGVLFHDALFDGDGKLAIEGLLAHESQRPGVDRLLEAAAAEKVVWLRPRPGVPGKPWVDRMVNWEPFPLLQGELAAGDPLVKLNDLYQETVIRKVRFAYGDDGGDLKCWIEANCLKPDFGDEDRTLLQTKLTDVAVRSWNRIAADQRFLRKIQIRKDAMTKKDAVEPETIRGVADSPVYRLQEMANRLPELDGTLVERAIFDRNGTFRLKGYVNDKLLHGKKLADFLTEREKDNPDWLKITPWLPAGPRWSVEDVKQYREALRPSAFQERLSKKPALMPRQTRVDRLQFVYEGMGRKKLIFRLEGASLHPDWPANAATVRELFGDPLMKEWLSEAHHATQPQPDIVAIVRIDEDPVPIIQDDVAREPSLDGMLFLPATYDERAVLRYPVKLLHPEVPNHRKHAERLAEGFWARQPRHRVFRPAGVGQAWEVDFLRGGVILQPSLQRALAESRGFKELRQVRLDRAWFAYGEAKPRIKGPELRCQGVALYFEDRDLPAPRPRQEVGDKLRDDTIREWNLDGAWHEGIKLRANLDLIVMAPHPGPAVQVRVARNEALDGTRVFRTKYRERYTSEFDAIGQLIVRGEWLDAKQEKMLRDLLTGFLDVRLPRLHKNGLVLQREPGLKTPQLLHGMRLYAADRLEDVLLQRLFYDDEGELKLAGSVANEKDRAELLNYLKELLERAQRSSLGRQGIEVASAGLLSLLLAQPAPPAEEPRLDLKKWEGLTAYLRRTLQASTTLRDEPRPERWDGLLLSRGFYTPEGDYVLKGLIGTPGQRQYLEVLLQELAGTEWRPQLPNAWSLEGLQLMPNVPMVERLRVVMPAYSDLDHLTLQRAFHDVQGRLVLRISVIGERPRDAQLTFKRLLDAHPEWKNRSAAGVVLQESSRFPVDQRVVEESILKAVENLRAYRIDLAKDLVSTAILHDPEDSTGWYLRALCFLVQRDYEQADRDLRRSIQLEREGVRYPGPRANLRLERIELLQNRYREMLNERRKKVLTDVEAGKPALTLARTP